MAIGNRAREAPAVTHEKMRRRFVEANAEIYRRAAEGILAFIPQADLPMRAETFVRVLHGLMDGLMLLRCLTPELIDNEVFYAAFEALGAHKAPKRSG